MLQTRTPTIALVGNPNTGKTTLFNALAGMKQRVGNYPGVTVEIKKGRWRTGDQVFNLVDLPGTYSLAPRSPDEMVAVNLILGQQEGESRPDLVVAIADASNLERNLYLMTQVLELGVPVVVALNMTDIADSQGIRIDVAVLSRNLGVPVVPIQANKGKGLTDLRAAIVNSLNNSFAALGPVFPDQFEREVTELREVLGGDIQAYLVRRLLLDVGGHTEQLLTKRFNHQLADRLQSARKRLQDGGCSVPAIEARTRYGWIRNALTGCIHRPAKRVQTWTDRLDRVLTHKVWGTSTFVALMFVLFQSIYTVAKPLMEAITTGQEWLGEGVKSVVADGPLQSLLVDGVIGGVGGVLVFLPQILILFAFVAVLEDCGYMARAAFLMDKLMSRCGLSGKSFIPLLSSVACAVPGIMAARVIENRRDRFATILVAPLMSCSARLPVYMLLIGAFMSPAQGYAWWVPGITLFAMYAIGLIVAPLVALILKRTLLRGETPVFIMEMPLYKLPSLRTVCQRTLDAGAMFVRRAGTLILASMIIVWALLYFPSTSADGRSYPALIKEQEEKNEALVEDKEALKAGEARIKELQGEWKSQSILGRIGKWMEPAVEPLGWDWRIGMAVLASFPAREVIVGTLGIIYGQGEVDTQDIRDAGVGGQTDLGARLAEDRTFSVPVALSVMVFFALCCQCASTLAVIKRETNSWRWPAFTFVYMTALAYVAALIVYQVSSQFRA